jgi:heme oxygenase
MATTLDRPQDLALHVPIMDRLRAETRAAHADTESVPFNQRLIAGTLPLQFYIMQLNCLHEVHQALEQALASSMHPAVMRVWHDDMAKVPLLRQDLAYFERSKGKVAVHPDALAAAAECVRDIHHLARTSEVSLLGVLYVLEGSMLGGTILRKHLAAAFDLERDGLAYYTPYGNQVMPHWQQFKARMNDAIVDPGDQQAIIDAAQGTFSHVKHILLALSA